MGVTDWNAEGDIAHVLDAVEAATLVPADGGASISYPQAWRFIDQQTTVGERSAAVTRSDATWHLPIDSAQAAPRIGDRLVDAAGACWVLRRVERLRAGTRYRCYGRSMRLRREDAQWCRIERAIWLDGGGGPAIDEWRMERPTVSAAIQVVSALAPESEPDNEEQRVRITFAEMIDAGPQHRVVSPQGVVYRLVDRVAEPAPGELPEVEAVRAIEG